MSSKCCLETLSQIASEAISKIKIFLGGMPPDPPSRHAYLCVRERAFTCYYHPATILFPPQLKILYETLVFVPRRQNLCLGIRLRTKRPSHIRYMCRLPHAQEERGRDKFLCLLSKYCQSCQRLGAAVSWFLGSFEN